MALITTLLMMGILSLMLIAFMVRLRAQGYFGIQSQTGLGALNAAEAGVADALSRLTADPTWQTDVLNQPLAFGNGSYSIRFGPSVNNIGSLSPVPGPRGPVEPGTAYIVVEGRQGLARRTVEVIIGRGGPVDPVAAMVSTGQIRMKGNVLVDGLKSLTDPSPVDVDVVSNLTTNQAGLITWSGAPGEKARVVGRVRSSSPHPGAIAMPGATITGGTLNNQPAATPPAVDILGRVSAKSSAPAPVMAPGLTTLPAGDYYVNGNLTYTGDIDLKGANLYVNGNLTVDGTIKGEGSVFTAGSTSLYGDSQIAATDANQVALYSKGSVSLHGFDGTKYLDNLVATAGNDPNGVPYSLHWSHTKDWTARATKYLFNNNPGDYGFQGSNYDYTIDMLASTATASVSPPFAVAPEEMEPIVKLNLLLQAQPPSPSQAFLIEKLTYLKDPTDNLKGLYARHSGIPDSQADTSLALATGSTEGLADGGNDAFSTFSAADQARIYNMIYSTMLALDYDKVGSAYFNGMVYTNGYFYSDNDVSIRGGLLAVDDGSQGPGYPDPLNPTQQVKPGDIYLNNGVRLTYVDDMMDQSGSTIGTFRVKVWMGR